MAKKKRTAREALVEALRRNGEPMEAGAAVAAASKLATGLVSDKTRKGTLYGTMREEALKPDGLIEKVDRGLYRARTKDEIAALKAEPEITKPENVIEVPEPEADVQVEPHPKPATRKRSTARKSRAAAPA